MNLEDKIINIKKLNSTLSGKDEEVSISYKGTSHGVTKPWYSRVGNFDSNSVSLEDSVNVLFNKLKAELKKRTESLESQVAQLKTAMQELPISN